MDALIQSLVQANFAPERIAPQASMAQYTTLRIGGPAEVMVNIHSADEIAVALRAAKQADAPVTIIGNGSNLLVRDGGIRGLVLRISGGLNATAQPLPQTGGLSGDGLHAGRDAVQRAAQAPGLGIGLGQGLSGTLAAAGHVLQAAGGAVGLLLDAARAVAAGKGIGGLSRVTGSAAHAFHGIPGLGGLFGHTAHAAFCRARGGTHGIHGLFSRAGEVVPQGELHLYVKISHAIFSIAASPDAC